MGLMEGASTAALGAGLGMITADWQDRRQLNQQAKLNEQQIAAQAKMMGISYDMALKMWEATNYSAQVEQMKKAGVNVGLMLKGTGAGGTLQQPQGSVAGGQAAAGVGEIGMGLQLGLQKALQEAQIENIQADTEMKKVEAKKRSGVDTDAVTQGILESQTRIESLKQSITNAKTQNQIDEFQKEIKATESRFISESLAESIKNMQASTAKLIEGTIAEAQQNKITSETMGDIIKQAKLTMIGQSLMNELTREKIINTTAMTEETWAKINKVSAEIERMTAQTAQGEKALDQNATRIAMEAISNEFNYGDDAKIIRWINAIGGALGDITGMISRHKMAKNATHRNAIEEYKAHKY